MPNLEIVFRKEISRIVSKELRKNLNPLVSKFLSLKKEIASQRLMLEALLKKSGIEVKTVDVEERIKPLPEEVLDNVRTGPKLIKKIRTKYKLSRKKFARILGVCQNSVYQWESGKSRPRKQVIAKIAAIRKMDTGEIRKLIDDIKSL